MISNWLNVHVKAFAFSIPGITALPTYLKEGELNNFIWACVGVFASFFTAFILTIVLPLEEKEKTKEKEKEKEPEAVSQGQEGHIVKIPVAAPMTGQAVGLAQVPDKMFAEGILGKGIAIIPEEGTVKAPFQGQVKMIAPTKHENGKYYIRGFYNKGEEAFIADYFTIYGERVFSIRPAGLKNLILERLYTIKNHFISI